MPPPPSLELAQVAYRAYGQATGDLNHRGEPMPAWDHLEETIQQAWAAAAAAVQRAEPAPAPDDAQDGRHA
ncbi:hypothetical protein [Sphaerisporangium sp. TRM90804]|uniref:hypothetical protein n=1 Tax=Sphaerisporangium sp. TRM90804 TaxID=3031113 RepID=UPI002447C8F4|nr:hypothetical protein [Sphaerisporangium sp. TRM90804]MDH2425797.1 hypothetical protein [Sphaerisporangium sp. TRM90804]